MAFSIRPACPQTCWMPTCGYFSLLLTPLPLFVVVRCLTRQGVHVGLIHISFKACEDDFIDLLVAGQKVERFIERDLDRFGDRIAVDAATDGWKGDCLDRMLNG